MLFYFIFLNSILATSQFNLYYTDWIDQSKSESENDNALQHNCLRVVLSNREISATRDLTSYCMSELPPKFNAQNNNFPAKFTFTQLSKRNVTSEHLYRWSTPIDIIERYQLFLNQLSISNYSTLAKQVFYNCTLPRFGPMCQYELIYHRHYSSFNEIIHSFYSQYGSSLKNISCYMHLQCNRGPHPACLDWTEICNGKIDCLDSGIDEEHCWQLEINECKDNEFRCTNGQCIPQSFKIKDKTHPGCLDASDIHNDEVFNRQACFALKNPPHRCEDIACVYLRTSPTPISSSCIEKREEILIEAMYSNNDPTVSHNCWSVFKCLIIFIRPEETTCDQFCRKNDCKKIVMSDCPNVLFFPDTPVLFGNIYFIYRKNDLQNRTDFSTLPLYICYNTTHYDHFFANMTKVFMNNMKCVNAELFLSPSILSTNPVKVSHELIIRDLHSLLARYYLPYRYTSALCNRSNMYQCIDSPKCISIYRLMDNVIDCPHMDDENMFVINNNINLIKQLDKTHFKCVLSTNKYIHQSLVNNDNCDCDINITHHLCEDEYLDLIYIKKNISFQNICDGFTDLLPIPIGERNETDETECGQWQCINIYTRCNNVWDCPDGADESGCNSHRVLNCSSKHHLCVAPDTNQFTCLSIEKANDGHIDCLGATDERKVCTEQNHCKNGNSYTFCCMNDSSQSCLTSSGLCNGYPDCKHGDDEQFCTTNHTAQLGPYFCTTPNYVRSDVQQFLCSQVIRARSHKIIHFILYEMTKPVKPPMSSIERQISSSPSIIKISNQYQPRCHRGLDLRIWLNNSTKTTCLCTPQYYGDQCQYQNQRVSLLIEFQSLSDSWQTIFTIIISLIDDSDQRIIHSYEQFNYLSVRDCKRNFAIFLLYSTRPKDPRKNYAIHIDIYETELLKHRRSLLYPIMFPFLPVHRLAFIVDIPPGSVIKTQNCSNDQCIHGQCMKYYNNPQNLTFCKCDEGWSGKYCTIPHTCTCSYNSLCIGVSSNNQSICVCPLHKFGFRCLLINTVCKTNNNNSMCQHGGKCIPDNNYFGFYQDFTCICPKGYSGKLCEIVENQLIFSFNKDIVLSQSIFIHFFQLSTKTDLIRGSTFKTIPLRQDSITIYWEQSFDLFFTELFYKIYYLTVVQKSSFNHSKIINETINPSDHCRNISEFFNQTFLQWHLIRRIKYYHLPCQNQSLNLSCFHDEVHFCLCYDFDEKRLANCFNFDHNLTFDCFGRSECENNAQCFQDSQTCPRRSMCLCPPCYYGVRCQFRTNGFGLSLDAILGYHIIPDFSLTQQPFIIKMGFGITILFIVIGFINDILCIITFKNKSVREVGCGLYLLASSITTLLVIIMFGLKFLILILAQMTIISNRTFLQVQCYSIDFLLRVCLCMDQWLNACVATERAVTVIKATSFDKKTSKQAAKYAICILLIINMASLIHDPIYRELIDEENDDDNVKRTWCIVKYSSGLAIYDYFIHSLHCFGPFIINLLSVIILITKKSRQQLNIRIHQSYKEILRKQIREHKHLLIAPIVLVILALPRLIITFVSKCMKSTDDSWLFLVGYFISFIPSMLTFVIFIVPSKFYKKEFRKTVAQYRKTIQRRLNIIS